MTATADKKPPRLRFIDLARAVAILLMLEGHFVHLTLANEWRIPGVACYDIWHHARGLAAPMFFCVTGLIFSYLLCGAPPDEPYFKLRRVRRGMLRVAELMFWGYMLQFYPALLTEGINLNPAKWTLTFHVLQCIGCGLLAMMAIFGLLRRFGAKALVPAFFLSGFSLFLLDQVLQNYDGYWPTHAPVFLQNFVKGPGSHFSIAPWLGFTLYGAAIGSLARHHQQTKGGIIHPLPFILIGLLLARYGWRWDNLMAHGFLDTLGYDEATRKTMFFFHGRFGEILIGLGLLICFDKWVKWNTTWLEVIGRNTFPIYVVHVVVLYGGIFEIGIDDYWDHSLNPWQAAAGALVFMILFGLMAHAVAPLSRLWSKALSRLRGWKQPVP